MNRLQATERPDDGLNVLPETMPRVGQAPARAVEEDPTAIARTPAVAAYRRELLEAALRRDLKGPLRVIFDYAEKAAANPAKQASRERLQSIIERAKAIERSLEALGPRQSVVSTGH